MNALPQDLKPRPSGRRPRSNGRPSAALERGAGKQDVIDQLSRIAKGSADRRVRLTHAVMLVRSEAAPDLYEKVLRLSREL